MEIICKRGSASRCDIRSASGRLRVKYATSLRRCAAQRLEDPFSRGWMLNQLLRRTPRAHHEFAATIGAAARQNALSTGRAECAFKRADFRSSRVWRQIGVAAFTIGTQLKHRTLQLMVRQHYHRHATHQDRNATDCGRIRT